MRRRGFTLLETLVALAITALVLAALGGAVVRAASARARASRAAERTAAGRTVLLRLAAELEAARATEGQFMVDTTAEAPWSAVRFVTAARVSGTSGAASDLHEVAYRVEPEPARPDLGALVRRAAVRPEPAEAPVPPGVPLLGGLREFRVRSFDGGEWRTAWSPGRLPRAVEITLAMDDGAGGSDALVTRVTLAAER